MFEQRGADAAVTTPADDNRAAGLETAVLELPDLSHGPAAEADAVWVVGDEFANDGLVGIAPAIARATASTTVRARGCSLRKSRVQDSLCHQPTRRLRMEHQLWKGETWVVGCALLPAPEELAGAAPGGHAAAVTSRAAQLRHAGDPRAGGRRAAGGRPQGAGRLPRSPSLPGGLPAGPGGPGRQPAGVAPAPSPLPPPRPPPPDPRRTPAPSPPP